MGHRAIAASLLVAALAAPPLAGCQLLSVSATSASDWAVGSSRSVSGSLRGSSGSVGSLSGGEEAEASAWEQDVRVYAAKAHREGRGPEAFLRGLGRLGDRHGIVRVAAEPGTRRAAAAGLADAGASFEGAQRFLDRAGFAPPAPEGAAPAAP